MSGARPSALAAAPGRAGGGRHGPAPDEPDRPRRVAVVLRGPDAHSANAPARCACTSIDPEPWRGLGWVDSANVAILLELLHDLLEVALTRGRVDRRGFEPLMTQERCHAHQVGPRSESVLAEAVAKGMGRDVLEASQAGILGDQQLDGSGADTLPALTNEELSG